MLNKTQKTPNLVYLRTRIFFYKKLSFCVSTKFLNN